MSRRLLTACLVLALSAFVPGAALAGSSNAEGGDSARSKFYDFGEQLVNGSTRGPTLDLFNGRRAADFGRLLSLKKDLLPQIFASRAERTFK